MCSRVEEISTDMAFCSSTVSIDKVINPMDLVLDPSLVKWKNPKNKDSHYYYQKLWLNTKGDKKYLVFETPLFYSKHGLMKSMNNSDQLFVQLSEAQRTSLSVIEQFMRTNAKFTDELETVWKKHLEENPQMGLIEKFRPIYPSNSLYMKLHEDFEAFDSNYSMIDKADLKAGYYRALFHVSGLQYGEFNPSKAYLCALSIKVLQVVYVERKSGICYLDPIPFTYPDLTTEHESQNVVDSVSMKGDLTKDDQMKKKKRQKLKKKRPVDLDEDGDESMMDSDDTLDADSVKGVVDVRVEKKRKKFALK